jgi:integrase
MSDAKKRRQTFGPNSIRFFAPQQATMPNPGLGELYETDEGFVARITIDGKRRCSFLLSTCKTREQAEERRKLLADIAAQFRKAKIIETPDARRLLETVASCSPTLLPGVRQVAGELVGGLVVSKSVPAAPTFGELADEWTSGRLAKRFPDQLRDMDHELNKMRLKRTILPILGPKPLNQVTRADCDAVMASLPTTQGRELSRTTRRAYASLVHRILNLAELAGYVERNPLPKGWVPKAAPRPRYPILYPSEDAQLLAAKKVPIGFRLLFGFLHREGMRRGEAVALQFKEIDFEHETIALDENKTDHPRWWKLSPGTARVLKRWQELRGAGANDLVFADESGAGFDIDHMAGRLRGYLKRAELTRADLYSTSPLKRAFGVHCFRRSFVTRSLALGRNEDWVRQRTGHTSDELLGYRQAAKSLAELELGDLAPLDKSLPDLWDGPTMAHEFVDPSCFEVNPPRPLRPARRPS